MLWFSDISYWVFFIYCTESLMGCFEPFWKHKGYAETVMKVEGFCWDYYESTKVFFLLTETLILVWNHFSYAKWGRICTYEQIKVSQWKLKYPLIKNWNTLKDKDFSLRTICYITISWFLGHCSNKIRSLPRKNHNNETYCSSPPFHNKFFVFYFSCKIFVFTSIIFPCSTSIGEFHKILGSPLTSPLCIHSVDYELVTVSSYGSIHLKYLTSIGFSIVTTKEPPTRIRRCHRLADRCTRTTITLSTSAHAWVRHTNKRREH